MYHASHFTPVDQLPLLDDEFDRDNMPPSPLEHTAVSHHFLPCDLAWDDQLDEGQEMSL